MLTTWSVTRAENWRAHGFVTTRYFSVHNKPSVASYEALLKEREYKLIAQEVEFRNRSWWDYFDKKKPQFKSATIPVMLFLMLTGSSWISRRRGYNKVEQMQVQLQTTQLNIQHLKDDKEDLLRAMFYVPGHHNSNMLHIVKQSLGALIQPTPTTTETDRTFY